MVLDHLQTREASEIEEEKARRDEYERDMRERKTQYRKEPEPARRLLVSDITTEGLLAIHARAPLGLLLYRDELGGWLKSYNQYKNGGRGSDAQTWSEMHQGRPALIDRKGSPTLSVPRAAVSIVGGIQPELVRNTISGEHLFDGIAARILFVAPPERVKRWTEATISNEAREGWSNLLDEFLALQPDEDGAPVDLEMTRRAKDVWIAYYNEHAQREAEAEGPFRSALSKLEATTARLALVMQLAENPQSTKVRSKAMDAGIALSLWFEEQARRVYEGLEESQQEQDRRDLCDWIKKQGGETTQRQLARLGPSQYRKRAGEALADLVAEGLAERVLHPGRQADKYVLCDCDNCDR